MNYAAINAKLRAMEAGPGEDVKAAAACICKYVHIRAHKNFLLAVAHRPQDGINFYIHQWKQLGQLGKANSIAIKSILGAEIDLLNILWLYRLKIYHRIHGAASYGHLIPIRYRLTGAMTQRMADCESPASFLEEVGKGPYAKDIVFPTTRGMPTPEEQLAIAITKRYQAAARKYPNSLVPALAFIHSFRRFTP